MDVELGKKANKADMDVELGKKFDKTSVAHDSGESEELVMSQKAVSSITKDIRSVTFESKGKTNRFSYLFKKGMHLIFDIKNEGETPNDGIFFKKNNTTVFNIPIQALANNGEFKIILPCDIDLISLSSGSMEYTIKCEIMSRNEQMINEAVSYNDFYFSGNIPSSGISKIPFDISEGEEFYIDLVHEGSAKIGVSDGANVYLRNNGYGKFIAKKDINVLNLFNDTHETDLIEFSLSRYSIKQNLANIDTELGKKANKADMDVELGKKFDKTSVAHDSGESEELVMSQKAVSSITKDIRSVTFESKGKTNRFSYLFKKGMHLIFDIKNEGETPNDGIFFKKNNTTVFNIPIQALANNGEFKIILPCDIDLISLSSGSMEYTIKCEIMSRNEQMINEAVSYNDFYFSGNIPSSGISKIPFDISEGEEFYIDLVHEGSAKIGVSDGANVYLRNNGYGKFIAKKDINVLNLFNDTHETDLIEFSLSRYSIKQNLANIDRTVGEVSEKLSSKGAGIGQVLTSNGDGTSTWKEPAPSSTASGGNGCTSVTIAAYNAKTKSRKNADFLCTGTNDDEIINQAIQSLSPEGGEIKLTDGLFLISSPILIDRRIKITGEGYGICGIPQYTPTDSECKYENLYGSNVGITTIRCTADIDVIRIYSENKLQGIQLRDFVIQGYGKDRHTKSGISIETDTDVFYMTGVGIYDCHVGFYSHGQNMDAPNIIYNSFQWCACGAIVQAVFGRFVGNCIADNNGIKEYKGLTVNTGGLAISGSAMSILDNQFVRTERYTIPKDGRKFDENLLGSSLSLGYYTDFTNDKKKECGNFIVSNNTINQNGGNGIRLLFANFTNISNNNITTYGLSKRDGFKCGISGDKLGSNTIILGNKIGNPSSESITADQGVNLKCTYGNNLVCNNMFTWLSGSSVTCGNSASNNTISNNVSIT